MGRGGRNHEHRDDRPVAIHLEKTAVIERVRGYRVGTISVQDEDAGETYSFSFSDNRFTVADQTLRLKSGIFVSHKEENIWKNTFLRLVNRLNHCSLLIL